MGEAKNRGTLGDRLAAAQAEERRTDKVNAMIDSVSKELINGSPKKAAQALQDLAYYCKQSEELFQQMRRLAVTLAISKSNELFIMEKLKIAEGDLRDERRIKH